MSALYQAAKALTECSPSALEYASLFKGLAGEVKNVKLATDEEIQRAIDAHATGSDDAIEVDPGAHPSSAPEGVWVQGWLWLPDPLPEEDADGEDEVEGSAQEVTA